MMGEGQNSTGMETRPNERAWAVWVSLHAGKLLLFARQQTRCEADAQDVTQEAILEATRRCENGDPPPLPLVFATIRRRAIDLGRKEDRRQRREAGSDEAVDSSWYETDFGDRELVQIMQSIMTRIPSEQREVITLRLWGGLTFEEVGTALEIPTNTAASRYRRGLETLRSLMCEVGV